MYEDIVQIRADVLTVLDPRYHFCHKTAIRSPGVFKAEGHALEAVGSQAGDKRRLVPVAGCNRDTVESLCRVQAGEHFAACEGLQDVSHQRHRITVGDRLGVECAVVDCPPGRAILLGHGDQGTAPRRLGWLDDVVL